MRIAFDLKESPKCGTCPEYNGCEALKAVEALRNLDDDISRAAALPYTRGYVARASAAVLRAGMMKDIIDAGLSNAVPNPQLISLQKYINDCSGPVMVPSLNGTSLDHQNKVLTSPFNIANKNEIGPDATPGHSQNDMQVIAEAVVAAAGKLFGRDVSFGP